MINCVGYDKNGQKLDIGDICRFRYIDNQDKQEKYMIGMVDYSEDYFAFEFEMLSDNFPALLMRHAVENSIEKIVSVWHTANMPEYADYQRIAKNSGILP